MASRSGSLGARRGAGPVPSRLPPRPPGPSFTPRVAKAGLSVAVLLENFSVGTSRPPATGSVNPTLHPLPELLGVSPPSIRAGEGGRAEAAAGSAGGSGGGTRRGRSAVRTAGPGQEAGGQMARWATAGADGRAPGGRAGRSGREGGRARRTGWAAGCAQLPGCTHRPSTSPNR